MYFMIACDSKTTNPFLSLIAGTFDTGLIFLYSLENYSELNILISFISYGPILSAFIVAREKTALLGWEM